MSRIDLVSKNLLANYFRNCRSLEDIKKWWNALLKQGPDLGYFPNAMKCWLITKPDKEVATRILFDGTAINVTARGHRHLDAALRSREYLEEYVSQKVEAWVSQVVQLAEFAKSQPQASYAAYIFGLRHTWTYFQRTLPDVDELLEPLERAFADSLEGCPILSTRFYWKNRSSIRSIRSIWQIENFSDDPTSNVFYLPFASH